MEFFKKGKNEILLKILGQETCNCHQGCDCGDNCNCGDDCKCGDDCNCCELKRVKEITHDGPFEKHLPKISKQGDMIKIEVGEIEHPMLDEHYIQCIILENEDGVVIKYLCPGEKPCIEVKDENFKTVYTYCNLHGLWRKDI